MQGPEREHVGSQEGRRPRGELLKRGVRVPPPVALPTLLVISAEHVCVLTLVRTSGYPTGGSGHEGSLHRQPVGEDGALTGTCSPPVVVPAAHFQREPPADAPFDET